MVKPFSTVGFLGILGFLMMGVGALLLSAKIIYWYPLFLTGGLIFFAVLNHRRIPILSRYHNFGKILRIYLSYLLVGMAVEGFRTLPDFWDYVGIMNDPRLLLPIVAFIYPILLAFSYEVYLWIRSHTRNSRTAFLLALVFLIFWNEVPQHLWLPLWVLNPEWNITPGIYWAVVVPGYMIELGVPVWAHRRWGTPITRDKNSSR